MTKHFFPELTPSEQGAILRLWAASVAVAEEMPLGRRALVQGLEEVLEAIADLPTRVGFGPAPPPASIKPRRRQGLRRFLL